MNAPEEKRKKELNYCYSWLSLNNE